MRAIITEKRVIKKASRPFIFGSIGKTAIYNRAITVKPQLSKQLIEPNSTVEVVRFGLAWKTSTVVREWLTDD